MAQSVEARGKTEQTQDLLLAAALEEFSTFGFRKSSMEGIALRAGVSRTTLYMHWKTKADLLRGLVEQVHNQHLAAMRMVLEHPPAGLEQALVAILEARFLHFVELTSSTSYAAELYDVNDRLCGDIARSSQKSSERLIAELLGAFCLSGEADLSRVRLTPADIASVLFDCAHGAKGEDLSLTTPAIFRKRLARVVRVVVTGIEGAK